MGFSIDDARIANLRDGYLPNHTGLNLRARATRNIRSEVVRGDHSAPKNVSLTPTLAVHDVSKRIERVARLLVQIPTADDVVADVPMAPVFEPIAPAPAATRSGPKDES